MKRVVWLPLTGIFVFPMLLLAQNQQENPSQDSPKQMMGTICSSACVVQQGGLPTCDTTCTDKSGSAVFVSDSGKVAKVNEQDQKMCKSHMGKHVKIMAVPTEKEREESLRVMQLVEQAP
jgi:hypothetical protein